MANGAPTVSNGLVISGVTTSTTFSGSGASLTNLNASNIASGTVPTARLGSGTANSSTFLAGDSTFKTITGTTINNNADNRLITGSGTANTLEGEANLTFSGSTLKVNNTTGHSYLKINSNDAYSSVIHFGDQSDDDAAQIWYDNYQGNGMYFRTSENTPMSFFTNGTQRLRINSNGQVLIGTNTNPTDSSCNLRVNFDQNTSSGRAIEITHNTNGADKAGAALGLAIANGGESTNAADLFFQTAINGSMTTKMTLSAGGILRHQISKNTTAIEITTHGDGAHSYGDEARMDFLMRNEVPQSTGNPAARIASYLQRGNNGYGLRFYARTNATTLFKAMEMTADYQVLPGVDGVQDLGSTSRRWRDVYTSDLDLSNETKGGNSIDGTWGSYKIEEGEDDLFIINRRNGKKYKFNLTEVS